MIANLVAKHDEKVYRMLEIFIGSTRWLILLSPIWVGIMAPKILVFFLTFLAVFWVYLAIRHSLGMIIGYIRYKRELKVDWYTMCKNLDFSALPDKTTLPHSLAAIRHFILIPAVNEPLEMFKDTLNAIFNQTFPILPMKLGE